MRRLKSFLLLSFIAMIAVCGVKAQNLIEGYTRVFYPEDLQEGKAYFIISDRTKFAGNSTGKPKGMSTQLDSYTIKWGAQYVYWGDFDEEEEAFQWIAEKVGEDQWAFKNKVKEQYLGRKTGSDNDVLFSTTPVGYTLTDLEDGAGRFYMISSEDPRSPHVQGFVRSDRPNNCLAKQDVGVTTYVDDVATNGYPARWHIYAVDDSGGGNEDPSDFFKMASGYYNILYAYSTDKKCWTDLKADAQAYEFDASLVLNTLHSDDPRCIYYIEAVDKDNGLYQIRSYATGKYVIGSMIQNLVCMAEDEEEPLLFIKALNDKRNFQIYNVDGEMFTPVEGTPYPHIGNEGVFVEQWKVEKVDATSLESPSAQLRLALARKMVEVGNPYVKTFDNLSEEQLQAFRNLWDKADEALANGVYDIIYERYISELDAAVRGEYTEPVYNKYQKEPLRVLSYNVRHCAGNDGSLNLPRTASVISAQNADVVALQEVDSVFSSRSNYKYQVKELAEATGMYGIFCSALTGYGIGILSKELPLSVRVVALTSDFEPRRMLIAEFQNYVFASLHVGLSAAARRGTGPIIKAEAERWVEIGKPFIIAGDFNDDGTDDEMQGARGVLTAYLQQNGFTYHSDLTTPTWSDGIYIIDNIISYDPIGGVEKVRYEVVNDKVTSDHMPILADLIIGFDDTTAIDTIGATDNGREANVIYNLAGQRVQKMQKGLYIVNRKRILHN